MKKTSNPPVFLFDLETTSLDANRGHILCAVGKWLGSNEYYTWRLDDNPDYRSTPVDSEYDRDIAVDLRDLCEEAQAVVAYYGGYMKFDVPYLNTRLLRWGERPCRQLSIVDPYQIARGKLRLARNNMDSVASLLGCKHKKYHLPWEDWHKAMHGSRVAMTKLLKYCVNDVYTLEDIYTKLLPLMHNHPYTGAGGPERCKACGGKTYSKGWRYLKKTRVQDRICKDCGWRGDGRRETLA